jgi:DNA-nicking Smr family endonuclease
LTPDLCAFCGQAEAQHDAVAQGLLCRRNHGGNGETYTTLRQHHEQL